MRRLWFLCLFFCLVSVGDGFAQSETKGRVPKAQARRDNGVVDTLRIDSLIDSTTLEIDSATWSAQKANWMPDPKKAMWLAIAIPGGGQIYNRKYWKLPIIYGGFLGCIYAMRWNNTMYNDYSTAYIDLMDDNPNTKSYENFLREGYDVEANRERLESLFKRKKDYYRRYRDLSMFCMIGVYALSVIDAYIDAEMTNFNISKDLSMRVKPAVITTREGGLAANSYGVGVSFGF